MTSLCWPVMEYSIRCQMKTLIIVFGTVANLIWKGRKDKLKMCTNSVDSLLKVSSRILCIDNLWITLLWLWLLSKALKEQCSGRANILKDLLSKAWLMNKILIRCSLLKVKKKISIIILNKAIEITKVLSTLPSSLLNKKLTMKIFHLIPLNLSNKEESINNSSNRIT
jgi:hypothetical protein